MNFTQAEAVLKTITMVNAAIKTELFLRGSRSLPGLPWYDGAQLEVRTVDVPDREFDGRVTVYHNFNVRLDNVDEVGFVRLVIGLIREAWCHEMWEAVHVNGVRADDPHALNSRQHENQGLGAEILNHARHIVREWHYDDRVGIPGWVE